MRFASPATPHLLKLDFGKLAKFRRIGILSSEVLWRRYARVHHSMKSVSWVLVRVSLNANLELEALGLTLESENKVTRIESLDVFHWRTSNCRFPIDPRPNPTNSFKTVRWAIGSNPSSLCPLLLPKFDRLVRIWEERTEICVPISSTIVPNLYWYNLHFWSPYLFSLIIYAFLLRLETR